jgi:predicted SnoaL-like aldol condensation-catalyzing enzyme
MRALVSPRVLVAGAATAALLGLGVASASPGPHTGRGGHGSACAHGAQLERNKRNVVAYYTLAFNGKQPERAVRLFVGDRYIQHNPLAADGPQAFIDFVRFFTTQNPQLNVDIKRVIAECDLVMTHSHLTLNPSDRGSAVADIFRLDRRGKIVEHWDVIQAVPATSANDNTIF